jgi:hypothetical protein
MATLSCVFRKTHGKVTKTNSRNSAFAVRFWPWLTANSLLCRAFFPGARQRASHAVSSRRRQLLFFAVRRGKTHGKDYLSCIVRRGARQRVFTVQNATVCPLPCAPTKNARQRVCRTFLGLWRMAKPLFPVVRRGLRPERSGTVQVIETR